MQCFKKKKINKEKHLEISLFYTCLPRTTIIWGMVPELRSETNIIFLSFWAIFLPSCLPSNLKNQNFEKTKKLLWRCHHFTNVYQKSQSYDVQFLRYRMRQIIFCQFGPFFIVLPSPLPLSPASWQIKILRNWKKFLEILSFSKLVP